MNRDEVTAAIATLRQSTPPQLAFARRATVGAPTTLGVLSASFNPLTTAHAHMLEVANAQFHFDEWLLLIALANVDKPIEGYSIADRVAFLEAWAATRPQTSIALCSHGRFVEKIEAIRKDYGAEAKIYFIVGYDTLVRLFDSKYYADMPAELVMLFAQCEFIATNRAEASVATVQAFIERLEIQPFAAQIHVVALDEPAAGISATQVRERLERRDSVVGLVPAEVVRLLESA